MHSTLGSTESLQMLSKYYPPELSVQFIIHCDIVTEKRGRPRAGASMRDVENRLMAQTETDCKKTPFGQAAHLGCLGGNSVSKSILTWNFHVVR